MTTERNKVRVLFLCAGNSCRSQMAEAWVKHLQAELMEAHSAGVEPKGMDPRTVAAMAEAGIGMPGQTSKGIESLPPVEFDYVITLCDHAQKTCPFFPARTRVLHVGFADPPKLASDAQTEEEAMAHYRRVRDEIRAFVEKLPELLTRQDA